MGFTADPRLMKILEGFLFYFLIILASPKILDKPSSLFVAIMVFSLVAPVIVFYSLSDASRLTFYITILSTAIVYATCLCRAIRIPKIKNGPKAAVVILWMMLICGFAILIAKGGLQNLNFDISRVYEYRQAANDDFYRGAPGYFVNWMLKICGPMLIAIGLLKRKYFVVALVFGLHLLFFGITSHKSVAAAPLIVIGVWFAVKSNKALSVFPLGLSFLIIFSMLIVLILGENWVASMLIRRALYVPAFLVFSYHDFFSHNGFVYWANSITSSLLSYPYDVNPAKLIGKYHGTDAHANAGFIATGYMHAGIMGVIFYAILVGLLFRIVDALYYNGGSLLAVCMFLFLPIVTLIGTSDLPTTLLTHGLGFALVVTFLYSSSGIGLRAAKTL